MKPISLGKFIVALLLGLFVLPEIANAATEYATFESFYRPSLSWPWIIGGAGVAALIVLATAIAFPVTVTAEMIAGTAVGKVGAWVGGLWGLSGAAATTSGLAYLGGGSIATGGFGIAGGVALLTAALSFGTGVVFDYGTGKAMEAYDYSKFVEQSKNMSTLPLPKNTSGPDSYEAALEVLENANEKEALSSNHNQTIIHEAINKIALTSNKALSAEDRSREQSLLALLYFTSNDYVAAKRHADVAYRSALNVHVKATLPAFIYATSSMYDEKPDFNGATEYFKYAVTEELDNQISPLLFAVYLDRMMYRFNDGYLSSAALDRIYNLSKMLPYDKRKAVIQLGLLHRYIILIKLEQQKIVSLTGAASRTIKDSPKTLQTVKGALTEYKSLLTRLGAAIDGQSSALKPRLERAPEYSDIVTREGIKEWETQWSSKIGDMHSLWTSYSDGVAGLESQVKALKNYQTELERVRLEKVKSEQAQQAQSAINRRNLIWWSLVIMVATLLIGAYLFRRRVASR